jgi:outer membrane receptor protein involved in Fe transport
VDIMHNKKTPKTSWLLGVAGAALCFNLAPAHAQQQTVAVAGPQSDAPPGEITTADQVVIIGQIAYRNRSEETAPVLEYGLDYFQRFEPLSAGDALKRVPSVTFLSDVLESDGVRLRGLDPAYTQILINGQKVPGSGSDSGAFGNGADGAFFVDRIPAELIERVELVRSASANRSGDAMAGAVNIVLRDAYNLEGGYIRLGALGFDDGRVRETYGGVWGGAVGGGRLLMGVNVQGRRNPKEKLSLRFDEPGAALNNYEVQTDTRDGTDYSANASYQIDVGQGEFSIDGFYVHTDRTQDENSWEYNGPTQTQAINTLSIFNDNDVDITQDSWSLNGGYKFAMAGGETNVKLGYARFEDDSFEVEDEIEYFRDATPFPDGDRFTGDATQSSVQDSEISAKLSHERDLSETLKLEFGVQYETKERENLVEEATRIRFNMPAGTAVPASGTRPFTGFAPATGGDNTIERTQIAPYVMLGGEAGAFSWEAGLRYESTEIDVEDRTVPASLNTDYGIVLPSAHLKWDATQNDRFSVSVAKTIRNPSFSFLSPALLEEELADNDFLGDPTVEPETAWGLDAGYERRLGSSGIAGINFFYRDVKDLIEVFNTGAAGSACEGDPGPITCFIFAPRNTGDGKVYGVELDYSAPLDFIGLPDTGVFVNYSWLDSDVDDEFGSRRFNSQSDYIYNVGFIHDMPALGASFGLTYRKQGDALSRVVGEEVTTSYEGVLEAFVEKRIGDNFTIRLTGSNLTDGSKDEQFDVFGSIDDQIARSHSEFELETETAGPTWQLIGRYSF